MTLRLGLLLTTLLALVACQAPRRPEVPPRSSPSGAPSTPVAETPASAPPARAEDIDTTVVAPATAVPARPRPLRGADLFERLRARLADPPCVQDRVVQRWERIYVRSPERMRDNLQAILPLLSLVLDELEGHHLPSEFALLPIVESWYRPDAGAPRSAYGLWQFTAPTARNFGLRVDSRLDERLLPHKATRAAVRYLALLHNRFGEWKLANMAYNAGDYRLQRALARAAPEQRVVSAAAHRPPGLSLITYEHVAKIQALACLLAEPARFGLTLPDEARVARLGEATAPRGVGSLAALARHTGSDEAQLRQLNPAWRRSLPAGASLLLPRRALRRLAERPLPPARAATAASARSGDGEAREHRVVSGDTLGAIAHRYGVALADLLQWNGIDARATIHPGQRLRLEP